MIDSIDCGGSTMSLTPLPGTHVGSLRNPRTPLSIDAIETVTCNIAQRFASRKVGTIVLRDSPTPGWGWFGLNLEPRMAIEPMGFEGKGLLKIYLETPGGLPAFEVDGYLRGMDIHGLREVVEDNRARIEVAWLRTMLYKGWLELVWGRDLHHPIRIVAYPGTTNARVHPLPLRWGDIIGRSTPSHHDVVMDRANGILILGAQEQTLGSSAVGKGAVVDVGSRQRVT